MANEVLRQAVKGIMALGKEGKLDEAYAGYKALFESPDFGSYKLEDQRQALKLMILAKGAPDKATPAVIEAHRAAIAPLQALVDSYNEPSDYELLGLCHIVAGDEYSADVAFRAGLTIERVRNPGSDLCGALMKRIAAL
jgi:hypothetical protein